MTNADIIKMVAAGLSDQVIVGAVQGTEKRAFDLTPNGLVALKRASVSDAVIIAMQTAGAPAPVSIPQPAASTATPAVSVGRVKVVLKDGTEVKLQLKQALSSDNAKVGDRIEFETTDAVVIDGHVVIEKGAVARGRITEAAPQRLLVRAGKLEFSVDSVKAVNAADIRIPAIHQAAAGRTAAGIKGKDADVPAGSTVVATIDGDWPVALSTGVTSRAVAARLTDPVATRGGEPGAGLQANRVVQASASNRASQQSAPQAVVPPTTPPRVAGGGRKQFARTARISRPHTRIPSMRGPF